MGGPVRKDKLFYFLSYEGNFDHQSASRFTTVPTAAIRRGDMSESPRPVYDPATGDLAGAGRVAFVGNMVPLSRISPIAQKIIDLTPLPNLPGLTNNYFATGPFAYDRHIVDTKVNWNATSKLSAFVRFGALRWKDTDPQVFGDTLGGPPVSAFGGNPGVGEGTSFSTTAAATYIVSPNVVIDGHFGWTAPESSSRQARLDEKIGLDFLGIPGTNGTGDLKGGWPRFQIDNYTTVGINEDYMPYYRRDPQFQYVGNASLTKGTHNIRFGMDLYRQSMNQIQEQFVGGAYHGGQGGFTFTGGPTTTRGGASSNQFNSYASFLLGLPANMGKLDLVPDKYTVRSTLYSLYVRDNWTVTPKLSISYGVRYEYFPFMKRADRGLERYDIETNTMLVCGLGSVPSDCRVNVGKKMFAPRLGIAWRVTDSLVIRAGYGLTNDPFVAMEALRANYPVLIPLNVDGPNSFQPAGSLAIGIPAVPRPVITDGMTRIPGNVALATVPQDLRRGYVQSWNLTIQKQLGYGFTGQAGYVATRQVRQMGFLDLNAGQVIGAGQAGRPLLQRFGRTATTTLVSTPLGTGQYNALQTTLERRFSRGFQAGANYTWSKSIGITDNSETTLAYRQFNTST
ncbi:MAG: TonB-dependent receptor [Bryobacteraceae bacterium]